MSLALHELRKCEGEVFEVGAKDGLLAQLLLAR